MAPSLETSTQSSLSMPQTMPVRNAAKVLQFVKQQMWPLDLNVTEPTTPTAHCSPNSLLPASRCIHPSLFSPRKKLRAIAYHIRKSADITYPLVEETTGTSQLLQPVLGERPSITSSRTIPEPSETIEEFRMENAQLRQPVTLLFVGHGE